MTTTLTFETIDKDALATLSAKGKADPTVVRQTRCTTIAQGRKFRHLNHVRKLEPHIVDEPKGLLGDDTAPNPTEALLAALGTCVSVGLQANAVSKGWTLRGIKIDLEADVNITSVWGTGDLSPKPVGLTEIRLDIDFDVEGASASEKQDVIAHALKWSPVYNTIKNSVPLVPHSLS